MLCFCYSWQIFLKKFYKKLFLLSVKTIFTFCKEPLRLFKTVVTNLLEIKCKILYTSCLLPAMISQSKDQRVIWRPLENLAHVKCAFKENNVLDWVALYMFKPNIFIWDFSVKERSQWALESIAQFLDRTFNYNNPLSHFLGLLPWTAVVLKGGGMIRFQITNHNQNKFIK